ncbi:Lysophospholipase catalytic domain [Rhizoctonia solani]|uniref:Lysophospholipase n=1 Tax=Rhizoctonia solani TaxID=456999 RepID=A0A8H7H7G5_9AGAM|nr:Lysophospholipase catalytic domain [Rhizoctonia solani]
MSGDEPISSAQVAQQRRQYGIGLLLLLIVVLEWTGSNFLTQNLFEDGYNKPFFVTYMNTASFALYLIPALAKHALGERNSAKRDHVREGYQALVDDDESGVNDECSTDPEVTTPTRDSPLTVPETARLASIFCVFWFAANWTVNASLGFTSVASTTILSSMSGFFTLLIGRAFSVETLNLYKLGAVIVSFAGSVLVSLADSPGTESPITGSPRFNSGHSHPQAIVGDFLALGSALFYALYVVLLKVRIGDESRINMQLFFGFVGIFNVLGFWPIGVLLHYTGVEMFEPPSSRKAFANTPQMFITLSSDFIYVLAMLKTTPLVVTVGLSLTIPLAVAGDLFLGTSTSAQAIVGATLVLFAFVVIGLGDREEASGSTGALHNESDRGRPTERHDGQRQVPPFSHLQDDEDLRKSVEAIFASRREQARRIRRESGRTESGTTQEINNQGGTSGGSNLLERGRSRTRSGTFRRERVSGSLRRSQERRTRSRTGRKSSSERDDASRGDFRAQGWNYDEALLSDSEENTESLASPTRFRYFLSQPDFSHVARNHLSNGHHPFTKPRLLTGVFVAGGSWYLLGPGSNCDEVREHPYRTTTNPKESPDTPIRKDTQGESVFTFDGESTLSAALAALTSWTWPEAFEWLQDRASILILELSRAPGSLWSEIVDSPPSPQDHPEYDWEAEVRLGDELCIAERAFLRSRRRKMRAAFARLFGVPIQEIDERDLPIVAIAASGGGFRAMVNTSGALKGAEDTGILNCTSYISGISGSCWALAMMYSGVVGSPSPSEVLKHLRSRIQVPYLDMRNFDIIITPPFNKYLLGGILHKATAPEWGNVSLTDIYGTLLSARLFVPEDAKKLDPHCLSLHQFRRFVDDGSYPMPIMTAISRHLRQDLESQEVEAKRQERRSYGPTRRLRLRKEAEELEARARWLWFEWSPYEVGCDELGAWIPSWALGRRFENGRNVERRPEISLTLLSGIFGSAFCASLQHYFLEVKPLLRDLPLPIFNWLNNVLVEKEKEFDVIHPVPPTGLPNFVKGLEDQLRYGSPDGITETETLRFMDAGAELNIPYYPLLRRGVDCIIALDASADSQDLWFTRAEEYAARRGLQTWPKGARWPKILRPTVRGSDVPVQDQVSDSDSDSRINQTIASAKESDIVEQADHQKASQAPMGNVPPSMDGNHEHPDNGKVQDALGTVAKDRDPNSPHKVTETLDESDEKTKPSSAYVWIGSSTDNGSSRVDDLEEEDLASRDGIGIVYMPLIPNEEVQRRYGGILWDPMVVSTWRFELQHEETDKLLATAEMNFKDGHQKIARVLKVMWMRKRNARLEREQQKWKNDFDRLVECTS